MVKRELRLAGRRERADRAPLPVLGTQHVAAGMTQRLHRDRSLPEGYQFGDAGRTTRARRYTDDFTGSGVRVGAAVKVCFPSWRAPHLNAAEQLARRGWNVIEGEHFDSDAERHPVIEGAR